MKFIGKFNKILIIMVFLFILVGGYICSQISNRLFTKYVDVTKISSQVISKEVQLVGCLESIDSIPIYVISEQYIDKIYTFENEIVHENEVLLKLNINKLNDTLIKENVELKKINQQINQLSEENEKSDAIYNLKISNLIDTLNNTKKEVQILEEQKYSIYQNAINQNESIENINQYYIDYLNTKKEGDNQISSLEKQIMEEKADVPVHQKYDDLILERENLNKKIEKITSCIHNNGEIYSNSSGVIKQWKYSQGTITGEDAVAIFLMNSKNLIYQAKVSDDISVNVGDPIIIEINNKKINSKVSAVKSDAEQNQKTIKCYIESPTPISYLNNVSSTISLMNKEYSDCVDIKAIRQDETGFFVYALEKKENNSIKYNLRKFNIKILAQNEQFAAIESDSLNRSMYIVTRSNQQLSAKDMVIVNE